MGNGLAYHTTYCISNVQVDIKGGPGPIWDIGALNSIEWTSPIFGDNDPQISQWTHKPTTFLDAKERGSELFLWSLIVGRWWWSHHQKARSCSCGRWLLVEWWWSHHQKRSEVWAGRMTIDDRAQGTRAGNRRDRTYWCWSPVHVKHGGPIVYFCGRVMKGGNGYGVVGHRNQPNHVQMVGYYDRGQSR
jgi:hypothetical protein